MSSFQCDECGHECEFDTWTRQRWTDPTGWACPYCKAWYSVQRGNASLIRGTDVPLESPSNTFGIWRDSRHTPLHQGNYQVKFTDESTSVTFYDGLSFVNADGDRIPASEITSWKGKWPV